MKRLLLVAVAVLVFTPAAQAKGPFQLCGASGCIDLSAEVQPPPLRLFSADGATPMQAAPAPASYYVIGLGGVDGHIAYWVPTASALRIVVRGYPVWIATLPAEDAYLRDKVGTLQPFAPPTRLDVFVDYASVPHTVGWLRLFTIGVPAAAPANVAWVPIWLPSGRSPWDDGRWLWISRKGNFLQRDGQVFRIPLAIAKKIRARQPLG